MKTNPSSEAESRAAVLLRRAKAMLRQTGMDSFLSKPVDSRTLFKTAFNVLSRQR